MNMSSLIGMVEEESFFFSPFSTGWCFRRDAQSGVCDAQGPKDKFDGIGFILEQVSTCLVQAVISDMG